MRFGLLFVVGMAFTASLRAQSEKPAPPTGESVNWASQVQYSAAKITFNTEHIFITCTHCWCVEIKTASGLTGLYVEGKAPVQVDKDNGRMLDTAASFMLRFNPADFKKYVKLEGRTAINAPLPDSTIGLLKNLLIHWGHVGDNALIPAPGGYAADFLSPKNGHILAAFSAKESTLFNFTTQTMY
jgi:hypothetical protein